MRFRDIEKIVLASFFCLTLGAAAFCAWVKKDVGTLAWLHSIYFVDERNGWIAGGNGTLLSTSDGGLTWHKENIKAADTFRVVHFTDLQNGWILCERSVYDSGRFPPSYLLRTLDGGKSWQPVELDTGSERLASFFFDAKGTGFAIGEGGIMLRMQDAGKTWKRSPLSVRYLMLDGVFNDEANGLMVGGGGTILTTSDDGAAWSDPRYIDGKPGPKINAAFFFGPKMGWTAGDAGTIYHTDDGGKAWARQPTGVSGDLLDVAFADAAIGYAVGDNGVILRSSTSGADWIAEAPTYRHRLEKIAFAGNNVFIVGYGGTVLTTGIAEKDLGRGKTGLKGKVH